LLKKTACQQDRVGMFHALVGEISIGHGSRHFSQAGHRPMDDFSPA